MKKVLVLFAHPSFQRSVANKALLATLRQMPGVTIHDLYQQYPSMFIDPAREQRLLREHDIIVFQHPFYWYSCPAILKEWMDQVLEYGFAFGPEGRALHGKLLLSVITTGGSRESYAPQGHNRHPITDYLLPFQQSAWLCGMHWLPPFVAYAYHSLSDGEHLPVISRQLRQLLLALQEERLTLAQCQQAQLLTDLLEEL